MNNVRDLASRIVDMVRDHLEPREGFDCSRSELIDEAVVILASTDARLAMFAGCVPPILLEKLRAAMKAPRPHGTEA